MEPIREAKMQTQPGKRLNEESKKNGKVWKIVVGVVAAAVVVFFGACCILAHASTAFFPHTAINGVDVSGLTLQEAQSRLETVLPQRVCKIYLSEQNTASPEEREPAASITFAELGVSPEAGYDGMAKSAYILQHGKGYCSTGFTYLKSLLGKNTGYNSSLYWDSRQLDQAIARLSAVLNSKPLDMAFQVGDHSLQLTMAKDGQSVADNELRRSIQNVVQVSSEPEAIVDLPAEILPAKTLTAQQLAETVDALPMMSQRTLVVVSDYDLFKAPEAERNAMTQILSDLPEYCCLVFVYDTVPYKRDARMKKLSGVIRDKGAEVAFVRQGQSDLVDWIVRRFRALGHDIDTADAQYLIFLCGDLMNGLISEIGKIGAYAQNRRVTRQDIDAVAIPVIDAVVFQMTDALTRKEMDRAFSVLHDLLRLQQAPIMILAVLGKHFRQLYTARVALESGEGSRWLMELWGMRSAYPADKLMEGARRHGLDWCRQAMRRCAETDLAMKSVSGADAKELLVSLVLELAAGGTAC